MTVAEAKATAPTVPATEKPAAEKRPREESKTETNAQQKRRKLGLDFESTTEFSECGILFTCQSKFVQRKAQTDAVKMLGRAYDIIAEEQKEKENADKKTDDVAAALEAEKKELAIEAHKFEVISDKKIPDGCCFVKFNKNEKFTTSPSDMSDLILQRVIDKKEMSKNVMKLSPLNAMCKPHLEQFKLMAEKIIKPIFMTKEGEKKPVWALNFKARNMKTISKDDVLKCVDQWSGGCPVSLDNPEICINVELTPLFCGVGLLKGWEKFNKYNLNSLLNPEQSKKDREAMKAKQAEKKKEEESKKEGEKTEEKKEEKVEEKKEEKVEEKKE